MPTDEQVLDSPRRTDLSRLEAGLDALETGGREKPSVKSVMARALSPLIAIVVIIVIWQIVYYLQLQPDYIIPGPRQVWDALANQAEQQILWQSTFNSIRRAGQGFLIALVLATPIGLALGLNQRLRAVFGPILTGLQVLPSVAWVPAAIIWFGLSDATIYTVVLLGAVPSIANGLIAGIDQIPPIYLRAGPAVLAHRAARRLAGLPRGPRAGLGVRLAVADGRRVDRGLPGTRSGPGTDAGHRTNARRHGPGAWLDRDDHGGGDPRRAGRLRARSAADAEEPGLDPVVPGRWLSRG
jgi:hypothetical protein